MQNISICVYNIKESVGDKMFSTIARSTLLSNRPFALRGHVTSFFYESESYMSLLSKNH